MFVSFQFRLNAFAFENENARRDNGLAFLDAAQDFDHPNAGSPDFDIPPLVTAPFLNEDEALVSVFADGRDRNRKYTPTFPNGKGDSGEHIGFQTPLRVLNHHPHRERPRLLVHAIADALYDPIEPLIGVGSDAELDALTGSDTGDIALRDIGIHLDTFQVLDHKKGCATLDRFPQRSSAFRHYATNGSIQRDSTTIALSMPATLGGAQVGLCRSHRRTRRRKSGTGGLLLPKRALQFTAGFRRPRAL